MLQSPIKTIPFLSLTYYKTILEDHHINYFYSYLCTRNAHCRTYQKYSGNICSWGLDNDGFIRALKQRHYYGLYLMFHKCLPHGYLNLNIYQGCFISILLFYYAICFSCVVSVSVSYSRRDILMCFLFSTHCFLKNTSTIPYSLQIYIVVDIVLYLYTLTVDYLLTPFSSLCLSYNLSQAQNCNSQMFIGILIMSKSSPEISIRQYFKLTTDFLNLW